MKQPTNIDYKQKCLDIYYASDVCDKEKVDEEVITIESSNGYKIRLCSEGYSRLTNKLWTVTKGYARRVGENGRGIFLHRDILNFDLPKNWVIDHINGNPLDNRLSNLRAVKQQQNTMNRGAAGGDSKYKGVWLKKDRNRKKPWCAHIKIDQKTYSIGNFETEEEAAKAYDERVKFFFGEYARLNFPERHPPTLASWLRLVEPQAKIWHYTMCLEKGMLFCGAGTLKFNLTTEEPTDWESLYNIIK